MELKVSINNKRKTSHNNLIEINHLNLVLMIDLALLLQIVDSLNSRIRNLLLEKVLKSSKVML